MADTQTANATVSITAEDMATVAITATATVER